MRLFTGLDLSAEIKEKLAKQVEVFRPDARINWSPVENLHITTKFIGEMSPAKLDAVKAALGRVPMTGAIPIEVRGLGWFPNPHQPRVFWAGVHASPALADLARTTDDILFEECRVEQERKKYSPHLTLARIKPPAEVTRLRGAVSRLEVDEFGRYEATEFHLYLSEPGAGGSKYTKLATFPLV